MAVTPVSLGPGLRAWFMTGLTHILCDGPVDPASFGGKGDAGGISPARPFPRQGGGRSFQMAEDVARTEQGTAPAPPSAIRPDAPDAVPGAVAGGRAVARPEATGKPHAPAASLLRFAPADGVPADPAGWPEPWKSWFAKIAPAPVLWTYHELGADLTGIGRSADRSAFFKNLLAGLGLPKGNSVFWPSAMPAAKEGEEGSITTLRPNPAIFSAGLFRLHPQRVIVFGETALEDIGLAGRIRPFRQEIVEGRLLLCLPEIGVLLQNQGQRASAVSLLRAVLDGNR